MTYWILIADTSRARLFTVPAHGEALRLMRAFDNPRGRAKPRELLSNQRIRLRDRNGEHGVLTAYEPRTPPHQREAKRFARQLAGMLDDLVKQGGPEENSILLLVPAPLLGLILEALSPKTTDALVASYAKNLTHFDMRNLRKYLGNLVLRDLRSKLLESSKDSARHSLAMDRSSASERTLALLDSLPRRFRRLQ